VEELLMRSYFKCLLCPVRFATSSKEDFHHHAKRFHDVDMADCEQNRVTSAGQGEITIELFEFIRKSDGRVVAHLRQERGIRREETLVTA
jgi:hypothetical protein